MSKTNNTIKINGKHYDAESGALLHAAAAPAPAAKAVKATAAHKPAPVVKAKTAKQHHQIAPAVNAHRPETAKTLMRRAVHKPATSQTSKALATQPAATLVPKVSIQKIDAKRLRRAETVKPSKLVSRFSKQTPSSYIAPVVEAGEAEPNSGLQDTIASLAKPLSAADQLIDKALREATSHLQPAHHVKHRRLPRLRGAKAAVVAVVVLAGFIGYQNFASLQLRMATGKAGFAARLPGYHPSGFSMGRFSYSAGNVALHFHSNSDSRSFAITEKPSNWDNQSLVNNFLSATGETYQTVEQGNRTVYLYGQNATWLSNHVWYQVQNNGALSDQQLSELAGSV